MQYTRDPMDFFPETAPRRVVSLVPSITGSLIDLGLGDRLVGVTDYCPAESSQTRIGGPKNVQVEAILRLQPDIVLANQEENTQQAVTALCTAGIPVWLAYPQTVKEMLADLWATARLFRDETAMDRVRNLEVGVEWAERAIEDQPGVPYFCPIWEDMLETGERWWMTFNHQTYASDVLRLVGGDNVFAQRERRYPLMADLGFVDAEDPAGRDTCYPRVLLDEIIALNPEIILLPDEPFSYSQDDCDVAAEVFRETPAARSGKIYHLDGSLITWPGTRLAKALVEFSPLFGG